MLFMLISNNRQIKLQPKHRDQSGNHTVVPWLNISGVWLEELGFKVGDMVKITTRDRLLIIEPLEGTEQAAYEYKSALQEMKQTLKKLAQ
jgi:antitoxin component of MazEF toxin-antitoxin module